MEPVAVIGYEKHYKSSPLTNNLLFAHVYGGGGGGSITK